MEATQGILAQPLTALDDLLDRLSTRVSLHAGQVLFEEGDQGDALFALDEGRLEISVLSEDGRRLVLDIVGSGALVGEIALFDPGPRTATLTALEPVRLRRLKNQDLLDEIELNPKIAIDLIRLAGLRMRWMNGQLEEQVFLSLPSRLARRILYLTDRSSPKLKLNQSQLAEFVGATREGVSNVLRTWKQDGILELTRGGLNVLDRSALEEISTNDF